MDVDVDLDICVECVDFEADQALDGTRQGSLACERGRLESRSLGSTISSYASRPPPDFQTFGTVIVTQDGELDAWLWILLIVSLLLPLLSLLEEKVSEDRFCNCLLAVEAMRWMLPCRLAGLTSCGHGSSQLVAAHAGRPCLQCKALSPSSISAISLSLFAGEGTPTSWAG